MNGLKRLLGSSRNQFGILSIAVTLVIVFLKWPVTPEGATDAEVLKQVLSMQSAMIERAIEVIAIIVGVLTGGTALEDAAAKLFGKPKE
jgi:hypothetical protein